MAQAYAPIGGQEPTRQLTPPRGGGDGFVAGAGCDACHGSGEVWLLDRHAGAVRMPCGCGTAREAAADPGWIAVFAYPCAAAGLCATVLYLL